MANVAASTPGVGNIASATTEYPSAETVRALLIKAACVNVPLELVSIGVNNLLRPQMRWLIIERLAPDTQEPAVSFSYPIPHQAGADRVINFDVEIAVLPRHALRCRVDAVAPGEAQFVTINYDTLVT